VKLLSTKQEAYKKIMKGECSLTFYKLCEPGKMNRAPENFKIPEFNCKCENPLCDGKISRNEQYRKNFYLSNPILFVLQFVRYLTGEPVIISSGTRCIIHNFVEKGKENSFHLPNSEGNIIAADFRIPTKFKILVTGMLNIFQKLDFIPYYYIILETGVFCWIHIQSERRV